MLRYRRLSLMLPCLLPILAGAAIPIDDINGEAYSDIGQLVKGNNNGDTIDGLYLNRMGATITVTDTIQNKLRLKIGVGGIFWQTFPQGDFWQNTLKFGPGITVASSEYLYARNLSLEAGYFPFKYDSPAMNLGEYLLRSESYPTYLATGGWTWVDSAYTRVLGVRLKASHFNGTFRHEIGVYWEFENPPLFDITPAYLFAWQPAKGIEIGGGIALRRWFTSNLQSPAADKGGLPLIQYVDVANFPEVQNQGGVRYTYTNGSGVTVADSGFATWQPGKDVTTSSLLSGKNGVHVQSVSMIQVGSAAGARAGIKQFLMNMTGCNSDESNCTHYLDANGNLVSVDSNGNPVTGSGTAANVIHEQDITRRAINLMGRVDLDFVKMFALNGTGPFRLYAELAVLGVQNQPVYYENVLQRMPIMVGVHVPTFGILDLLAMEMEYLDNPYPDSKQELDGGKLAGADPSNLPVPDLDYTRQNFTVPSVHGDDWKWSVHLVKTILPGVKVKLQVADDHLRLLNYDVTGILPSTTPQTVQKDQWYLLVHLQWGF